jgi:[acyl-carrier-protein] S-malonyltransferase
MAAPFADTDVAREIFDVADRVLGVSVSRLCLEMPADVLVRTEHAQPAIFTTSYIAWRLLQAGGVQPSVVAGHSVGEYAALVAAGALTFEDGLRLVMHRGALMARVADLVPGGMAAIVGVAAARVADMCRRCANLGVVEIANDNGGGQIVIAGEQPAIDAALELADAEGAIAVVPLNVSAPFHCRLMKPLEQPMADALARVDVQSPRVPLIANVPADYVRTPAAVRTALVRQLAGRVRWAESVARMVAEGVDTVVEVGAGRVLSKLVARMALGVTVLSTRQALEAGPVR